MAALQASAAELLSTEAPPDPGTEKISSLFSRGVFKAGIRVDDIHRSIRFYRDVLGWRVVRDVRHGMLNGEQMNSEVQASLGIPENERGSYYTAHVAADSAAGMGPHYAYIELVQFDLPRKVRPFDSRSLPDIGGAFFVSFEVENIGQAYNELKAKGVEFVSSPKKIVVRTLGTGETGTRVVQQVFFRDPDGTVLELVEFTDPRRN